MNIWSSVSTYFDLTVSEPYKALRWANKERHRYDYKRRENCRRFSMLKLLRSQKESTSRDEYSPCPLVHISSVREHYLHDWR